MTADDDLISAEAASQFLRVEKVMKPSATSPVLASVMPLNDAKQLIENQLLRLAMEQFKTTTKAARALGLVNRLLVENGQSYKAKHLQESKLCRCFVVHVCIESSIMQLCIIDEVDLCVNE
ncbi:hypothetical protein JCM19038_3043 [Geomicrobium sp. JCM 19038]|nr:hypothetical protein JCM19038_3043 [Geomicrobium sp. JCM 19038]